MFISLVLIYVMLSPLARAACREGCLANSNTVLGDNALLNNTGSDNTAMGSGALHSNTTGYVNTAIGNAALYHNISGFSNTGVGDGALNQNADGTNNTAVGLDALGRSNGSYNVAVGYAALSDDRSGSGNVALGSLAGAAFEGLGDNNIDIGNNVYGVARESNTIRIGKGQNATFIDGISGATVPSGVTVVVDRDGHLGTITSSERYKEEIKPMDKASESILSLKPVTFRYKPNLDPDGVPQFGLVAEDVAKVNPDLVARGDNGKPYAVRYEAVNAMLLNEFLKAHCKIDDQQKHIDALEAELKEQKALIRKVSAQIDLHKAPTQTVANNP